MDIYFRDNSGSRVGFIIGTDIKDNSGSRVGYIENDSIKDNRGSRIGYIEGNNIKNNYGTRVGYIEGNNIKDTYGVRIGYPESSASNIEMCAAALLLFKLKSEEVRTSGHMSSTSTSGEGTGVLALIVVVLWGLVKGIWAYIKGPFVEFSYSEDPAARKEWWGTCTRSILLSLFIGGLLMGLIVNIIKGPAGTIIAALFWLAFGLLPIIAVSIRRMHDIGKPGWWILIPFANFVMCGFFPGKIEGNKFV